jgi:xanthine dehydrogenase YagR molybdenum-binding subunit
MTSNSPSPSSPAVAASQLGKSALGASLNRHEARAKVTGTATFAAEHQIPGLLHGYLVTATIASGKIRAIDTRAATAAPGVLKVYTHDNAPQIFKPANNFINSKIYEARLPLSDATVHYAGQIIGLVIADTLERARHGAHLVQVDYDPQPVNIEPEQATYSKAPPLFGEELDFEKGGGATNAFANAAHQVDATYTTMMELHAPMEPNATIAQWSSGNMTVYDPSQWLAASQRTYAELLGLPVEKVRVVSPYLGGAFGCKAFPWSHAILCAAAAKDLKRTIKVVASRRQMTALTGHRSATEQRLRIGADGQGKLTAILHEVKSQTSPVDVFTEACTLITPVMYESPTMSLKQELGVMNVGVPTFMRAPGENPGMWAMESAMDELAWKLQQDPIALRLQNQTQVHQRKNLPFSSKHYSECLKVGAERFGWVNPRPQPRSQTRDGLQVGWGMAGATFPGYRGKAEVKVRLLPDGIAHVMTAGNDMGTGSFTIVAATAADTLGLPVNKIQVEMGDSRLPDGGLAGGSQMTASLAPAVMLACREVLKVAQAETAQQAFDKLRQSGRAAFEAKASAAPGAETKQFAFQSWGAHFCEVTVDEMIGRLRITRWVSVMDIGRVMNAKTAASQVRGGVIMGIGQALMEETLFDSGSGLPVVYDLATYHVASHADIPRIDVAFVGKPDLDFNPLGVRGVGEIGITGVAAAIANAVYHATGKRLRSLPIIPEKLV